MPRGDGCEMNVGLGAGIGSRSLDAALEKPRLQACCDIVAIVARMTAFLIVRIISAMYYHIAYRYVTRELLASADSFLWTCLTRVKTPFERSPTRGFFVPTNVT